MNTTQQTELDSIQNELHQVRGELATRAWTGFTDSSDETLEVVKYVIITSLVGALAAGPLLLALLMVFTRDFALAAVFAVIGIALTFVALPPIKKYIKLGKRGAAERNALLAKEKVLLQQLQNLHSQTKHQSAAPTPLDLAIMRQPSSFAQMMWGRFPTGRSPEEALRRLPADAPAWKIYFYRYIGWGLVHAIITSIIILTAYVGIRRLAG